MRSLIGLAALLMLGSRPGNRDLGRRTDVRPPEDAHRRLGGHLPPRWARPADTHDCAARNQPRLKAVRIGEAAGVADFTLVDVGPKNPGHVQALSIQLVDPDHLNIRFTFGGGAVRRVENIVVKRVRRS